MKSQRNGDRKRGKAADSKPMSVDVMEPHYQRFLADESVDITAKAEELDPADPGDLSGAALIVGGLREDAAINVAFGSHILGLISGTSLFRFVSESLAVVNEGPSARRGCTIKLASFQPIDGRLSLFDLQVAGAPEPALQIMAGTHCFGMIRGEALRRFLEVALVRATFGKGIPPDHLGIASEVIRICLSRPQQDLGAMQGT